MVAQRLGLASERRAAGAGVVGGVAAARGWVKATTELEPRREQQGSELGGVGASFPETAMMAICDEFECLRLSPDRR